MAYFLSLGALSGHVEQHGVEIVDPGIPLTEFINADGPSPAWTNQPSVRKVTEYIAGLVAAIPLHLNERVSDTDRRRVTDHPIARMLANPSGLSYDTPFRFWYRVLLDGLCADRWAAMRSVDPDGTPRLTRISPRRFRPISDNLDRIQSVAIYMQDGSLRDYDPDRFMLDVGYAPRGGAGTSPLRTLRGILDEAAEAVAYRRQIFKNGARIPGVVLRDKPWPAKGDARARFVAGWKAYRQGGGKEGSDALLEDGMKYEKVDTFNPTDLESLEGRRLTDIEVASAYHIPPEMVGAREGNYSNMDAHRQALYAISLRRYITAWSQAVNAAFRDELAADNLYIEPHMDAVLQGSLLEQAAFAQRAVGGPWMTRAEQRGRFNLPELPDTDELITPLNVTVGGLADPTDTGSQNLKSALGADMEPALQRQERLARTALGAGKAPDLDRARRELQVDYAAACAKHQLPYEPAVVDTLVDHIAPSLGAGAPIVAAGMAHLTDPRSSSLEEEQCCT